VVVLWLGLSLLSSVSKHNVWSYYDWVYCYCHLSVNTICGRNMIDCVVVVVCQLTQYVVVLWFGVSLLSSISKHNMWSYYG
jgi:hypothetical protein